MNNIQENIKKLMSLGLDNLRISALFKLCLDDFFLEVSEDIANLDESERTSLETELQSVNLDNLIDPTKDVVSGVLEKVYGMSYKNKLISFVDKYFAEAVTQAMEMKEFMLKLQSNDPDAMQKYQAALNSQDTKDLEEAMNASK